MLIQPDNPDCKIEALVLYGVIGLQFLILNFSFLIKKLPVFLSADDHALFLLEFLLGLVLLGLDGVEHLLLLLRRNAGRNGLRLSLLIAFLLLVGLRGVLLRVALLLLVVALPLVVLLLVVFLLIAVLPVLTALLLLVLVFVLILVVTAATAAAANTPERALPLSSFISGPTSTIRSLLMASALVTNCAAVSPLPPMTPIRSPLAADAVSTAVFSAFWMVSSLLSHTTTCISQLARAANAA